jgi:hypothetical protein
MADTPSKLPTPRLPTVGFDTFLNVIRISARQSDAADAKAARTYWVPRGISQDTRDEIARALEGLGLVDGQRRVNERFMTLLSAWKWSEDAAQAPEAEGDEGTAQAFPTALRRVLADAYGDIASPDFLATATDAALKARLKPKTNSESELQRATRFFLKAATHAQLPLSPELKARVHAQPAHWRVEHRARWRVWREWSAAAPWLCKPSRRVCPWGSIPHGAPVSGTHGNRGLWR